MNSANENLAKANFFSATNSPREEIESSFLLKTADKSDTNNNAFNKNQSISRETNSAFKTVETLQNGKYFYLCK